MSLWKTRLELDKGLILLVIWRGGQLDLILICKDSPEQYWFCSFVVTKVCRLLRIWGSWGLPLLDFANEKIEQLKDKGNLEK